MTSAKFLAEAFWKYNHVSRLRKYFQCGKRHSKVLSTMVLVYNYAFNDFQFLSIGGMVSVTLEGVSLTTNHYKRKFGLLYSGTQ